MYASELAGIMVSSGGTAYGVSPFTSTRKQHRISRLDMESDVMQGSSETANKRSADLVESVIGEAFEACCTMREDDGFHGRNGRQRSVHFSPHCQERIPTKFCRHLLGLLDCI